MRKSLIEYILLVFVFILGFSITTVYFFPIDRLILGLQNYVNTQIEGPVKVKNTNYDFPQYLNFTIIFDLNPYKFTIPFGISFRPGWNNTSIRLKSPPDNQGQATLAGSVDLDKKKYRFRADSYPLSIVIPNQKGVITGDLSGVYDENFEGEFSFRMSTSKLLNINVYPPVVRGTSIHQLTSEGSIQGRNFRFNNIKFVSDKIRFDGSMKVNLDESPENWTIDFNLTMKSPLQRKINQTMTFRELGLR